MGHNTVILICNDAMRAIDADPAGWWAKVRERTAGAVTDPVEFGHGYNANGFWVVWNQHADVGGIIAVGGNMATVLARQYGNWTHGPDALRALLQEAAGPLGYGLHRNRQRLLNAAITAASQELNRLPMPSVRRRAYLDRLLSYLRGHLKPDGE